MRVFYPTVFDPDDYDAYTPFNDTLRYDWPSTGDAYVAYEQIGMPSDVTIGGVYTVGPEIVRVLERDICRRTYRVIRERPFSRLRWWRFRFARWRERTNERLLETARVWGLANWEWGEIPSWRKHCKLFKGREQ